jgi:hypothetical protein
LPTVEPYPGAEHAARCPRCQQEIPAQTEAVQCPNCLIWHHQTAGLPCWTGDASTGRGFRHCSLCDASTVLMPEARLRWTPEGL